MADKRKQKSKTKPQFYPDSPSSVGSPRKNGFRKRTVRQRTPRKLCSLVLPPPLMSLFDDSGGGNDWTPTSSPMSEIASHHRYSSNASVVSASIASVGGMSSVDHLPRHLRVGMAQCDPLLVFDGRFVLVATCDGRIAIYSIFDFDTRSGISEDVEASERRKRAEWMEEDMGVQQQTMQGKSSQNNARSDANANQYPHQSDQAEVEEHDWDMRDRMHQREDAKQSVEPILVLSLPRKIYFSRDDKNNVNTSSYDEENATAVSGKLAIPPTIVAMCAAPAVSGTSLIEKRDSVYPGSNMGTTDGRSEAIPLDSKPSLDELIGHVAVLTYDGDVHVVEFRNPPSRLIDSQGSDEGCININEINVKHIPAVNVVLSFGTACLGATCICMYPVLLRNNEDGSRQSQSLPLTRLCIGYQSGLLAAYQIYSCTQVRTSPNCVSIQNDGHRRYPTANNAATCFTDMESASLRDSGSNIADPLALSQNDAIPLQRTRSEPIAASDVAQSGMTRIVGPPRVELRWTGKFDVSVRSLSSPGWGWPQVALLVVGMECCENAIRQVCMNGIGPSLPHHSLSPALSLEVINVTLAENFCSQMKNATGVNAEGTKCISLHDWSVWPAAGKEIKDGWMRGATRRGMDPREKLFRTLGLQRTSITSKICQYESSALAHALVKMIRKLTLRRNTFLTQMS
jgi:hypothetical protein